MKMESTNLEMIEGANQNRTLKNIRSCLKYQLKNEYGIEDEGLVEDILKLHGLNKDNFDFMKRTERLIIGRLGDESVDANANKESKTVMGVLAEMTSSVNKLVGFDFLYRMMEKDWGKKEAKRLAGLMYDYSLPIHDSSKLLVPYCWALDASHIVMEGRPFGQLKSKPPKSIYSYVSCLNETIHQMSNHLAGAIAVGTFFSDMAFIMIARMGIDLTRLRRDKDTRKMVENAMQMFVHSVNHLSRISNESPFTNVSIFDRPKLEAIFNDDNMGWILEAEGHIDRNYFFDYITELQNIYMDFIDKGDPMENGMPYRFPVNSLNISKDKNGNILDRKFFDNVCNREIFRYNIYCSEGTKVASCCRLINDAELLNLGGQVNSFGGSALSLGSHRVVLVHTNRIALESENKEEFYNKLDLRMEDATKILLSHRHLLEDLQEKGLQMFLDIGWIDMKKMFSTIGLVALTETIKTLGDSSIEELLIFINKKVNELATRYKIPMNIEQVPAESMAVRLCDTDKMLFGNECVPYELYSNQFIPLWEDATLFERMEADGRYNSLFTGGGIVHFNLGERTTPQQNKALIEYAVKCNSQHFALNAVYSQCANGHTSFGNLEVCPECGAEITDKLCRVVGFFTRISSWNKTRREWEFPRRKFKKVSIDC